MNQQDLSSSSATLDQVYLIDRDPGLLCRILGLYAARGIDVQSMDYSHAAQDVMSLKVRVINESYEVAEVIRVLVDKVDSMVGVIAAEEG
jgi:acetolactate synthase small subunit